MRLVSRRSLGSRSSRLSGVTLSLTFNREPPCRCGLGQTWPDEFHGGASENHFPQLKTFSPETHSRGWSARSRPPASLEAAPQAERERACGGVRCLAGEQLCAGHEGEHCTGGQNLQGVFESTAASMAERRFES
jgi:hypothetical protein